MGCLKRDGELDEENGLQTSVALDNESTSWGGIKSNQFQLQTLTILSNWLRTRDLSAVLPTELRNGINLASSSKCRQANKSYKCIYRVKIKHKSLDTQGSRVQWIFDGFFSGPKSSEHT